MATFTCTIDGVSKDASLTVISQFNPKVEFFRSKDSANGNYGTTDSDYKGEFGFDWYDETVDGKKEQGGKDGFVPTTVLGKEYLIPWLILWPPKNKLTSYPDILNDTSYKPVNEAKILVKISGHTNLKDKTGIIEFNASNNLEIIITNENSSRKITKIDNIINNGKNTKAKLTLNSFKPDNTIYIPVIIKCNDILTGNSNKIEVITADTAETIGQLNVMENDNIIVKKPHIFQVNVSDEVSVSFKEVNINDLSIDENKDDLKKLKSYLEKFDYLNKNSLNQALVYIKKPDRMKSFNIYSGDIEGKTYKNIKFKKKNQDALNKLVVEAWYRLSNNDFNTIEKIRIEQIAIEKNPPPGEDLDKLKGRHKDEIKGKRNAINKQNKEQEKSVDAKRNKKEESLLTGLRPHAKNVLEGLISSLEKHKNSPQMLEISIRENQKKIDKFQDKWAKMKEKLKEYDEKKSPKTSESSEAVTKKKTPTPPLNEEIIEEAKEKCKLYTGNDGLLFFVLPDIDNFSKKVSSGNKEYKETNPGYSANWLNTILALNKLLDGDKGGLLAHEYGHALGLEHTFTKQNNPVTTRSNNRAEIYIKMLKNPYNAVKTEVTNSFKNYDTKKATMTIIKSIIDGFINKFLPDEKRSSAPVSTSSSTPETESLKQGQTKENFMDYYQTVDEKKNPNDNMKSFSYKQIYKIHHP